MKNIKMVLYILILIFTLFLIYSIYYCRCNNNFFQYEHFQNTDVDNRVKWGIAPALNSVPGQELTTLDGIEYKGKENIDIPISKIIDDLDVIWDWQAGYNNWEEGKAKIYDINFNDAKNNNNLAKGKNVLAKYIPMQWGPAKDAPDKVVKYLELVKGNRIENLPKYVLSWNEPDMTGTILPGPATGQGGTGSSSAGIWFADTFVYGNAGEDLKSLPPNYDETSFKKLGDLLKTESQEYKSVIRSIQIATPVTANGPILDDENKCIAVRTFKKGEKTIFCNDPNHEDGWSPETLQLPEKDQNTDNYLLSQPCGGIFEGGVKGKSTYWINDTRQKCADECGFTADDYRCNGFPIIKKDGKCESQCGVDENGRWRDCRCNGWLDLLKHANSEIHEYWNNGFDIINIHGYHYFAHIIKLRILATILVFKDDIKNGRKIWLTETACIYDSGKDLDKCTSADTKGIEHNVNFINQLFWQETSIEDCKDSSVNADATSVARSYQDAMTKYNNETVEIPPKLPGLRSKKGFDFLDIKQQPWFNHGFEAVTFFTACIPGWKEAGFPDSIKLANLCDSRIFDKKKNTNKVWEALKGNVKPQTGPEPEPQTGPEPEPQTGPEPEPEPNNPNNKGFTMKNLLVNII
jgi:hypothetical protein